MPVDPPPPPPAIIREFPQAVSLVQAVGDTPQPPLRIPDTDLVVEVVGELSLQVKLSDVTRLLGLRRRANATRRYPPTILELITLVERNPARPPGRAWNSINALTIGYDPATSEVIVEYCLDSCEFDPQTRAPHPRRRMASYRAPEEQVEKRVNKKLGSLKKYEDRLTEPQ